LQHLTVLNPRKNGSVWQSFAQNGVKVFEISRSKESTANLIT
jgi:hypothetical protein